MLPLISSVVELRKNKTMDFQKLYGKVFYKIARLYDMKGSKA